LIDSISKNIPAAITVAGSDSGGGAGIQADLRTFAFHRVHGCTAITCVTAQNTLGVTRVDALPAAAVVAQIETVLTDIDVQAAKTGMLLNQEIITVVAEQVARFNLNQLVVDPVMVSRTGAPLIDEKAIAALKNLLIPLAVIVTPNLYEAQILSGLEIHTLDDMRLAAERIYQLGAKAVVVKGGGLPGKQRGIDIWFDGDRSEVLQTTTVNTKNTHGTGCTLSAAIAANLALGKDLLSAVRLAKYYVTAALHSALDIGQGTGTVRHFYPLMSSADR